MADYLLDNDSFSEDQLLREARNGNQRACHDLYRLHVNAVFRLSLGILLDSCDAEEVVQDSFAYAFRRLKHFNPALSSFRTWLYTITVSRCRNKRRRKWLPVVALNDRLEQVPANTPLPETLVERAGVREEIFMALRRLSPKLREAVVLRYFDGLTYHEMAEVLGCPQKTAESRVRLAHRELLDMLESKRAILLESLLAID